MITRNLKELRLKQNAICLWFTGLSGAGKTTIGRLLEQRLHTYHYFSIVLDGDILRKGLSWDLGYSNADRKENIVRTAQIAKLLIDNGVIVICCLISPLHEMRKTAQEIIGAEDFYTVWVNCPLEVCEQRDVKGLYDKARKGQIKDFTGIDSDFEKPLNPDIIVNTHEKIPEECVDIIWKKIKNIIGKEDKAYIGT
jgi:adenylylsulfate kinase